MSPDYQFMVLTLLNKLQCYRHCLLEICKFYQVWLVGNILYSTLSLILFFKRKSHFGILLLFYSVSETVKVCQCVHGTKPSPSDSSSGLVLGCQVTLD